MKHWNRRIGIKVLCFVLTVPLLAALILGTLGMVYLHQADFYTVSREEVLKNHLYLYFSNDSHDMLILYSNPTADGRVFELPESYSRATGTNLRFQVLDHTGTVLCTNIPASDVPDSFPLVQCWQIRQIGENCSVTEYLGTDYENLEEGQYAVLGYVAEELEARDSYYWCTKLVNFGYTMRYNGYYILLFCLLLLIICFVNLTVTAGRKPGTMELHPGKWDKLPTDVLLILSVSLFGTWPRILQELTWSFSDTFVNILSGLSVVAGVYCLLGLWMCLITRYKKKMLLKNTVIWKLCSLLGRFFRWLWSVVKALPMIWRTALAAGGVVFWSFLIIVEILRRFSAVSSRAGLAIVMLVVQALAVALLMLWFALQLRRLQKAGQALAAGDLEYQVDTTGLVGDLKAHGEDLNSIASGMAKAVEARMQSERMKTELITNVSHDIKNPLTSIISYAALIGQEPCENPKHQEYAQVLERKSQHLKRLLEDLVEVSKAATGNLEVELVPCEAGVLLEQLSGEFSERCQKANLTLIVRQPEAPVRICVDSRRIWRVFENLMSNACKYSLPGSRVYLSLEARGDTAVFIFRNTSREPLDISPEELLERFVRGDSARSTEGNGLGLSIAQSLTQLQGGEMHLGIDGDLFKVTLAFPTV